MVTFRHLGTDGAVLSEEPLLGAVRIATGRRALAVPHIRGASGRYLGGHELRREGLGGSGVDER